MSQAAACDKRHRFPPALIAHAVRLSLRFSLSLRAVEERLLERGVVVSYETLRRWVAQFGPMIARGLRRRQARSGDVWHLDEVQVSLRGRRLRLWRAVDETGLVLEEFVQPRRDAKAAKRRLRRSLKTTGRPPKRLATDELGSYAAARREVAPGLDRPAPTRVRATAPRTATCRAAPARGRCGVIARPAGSSGSSRCIRPCATASSRPSPPPLRPDHPHPSPRSLRRLAPSRRPRRLNSSRLGVSRPASVDVTAPAAPRAPFPTTFIP